MHKHVIKMGDVLYGKQTDRVGGWHFWEGSAVTIVLPLQTSSRAAAALQT